MPTLGPVTETAPPSTDTLTRLPKRELVLYAGLWPFLIDRIG
jgi:hypothetical protein